MKYVDTISLMNIAVTRNVFKGCFVDSKVKNLNIFQSNLDTLQAVQISKELQSSQLIVLNLRCNFIQRKGYNALSTSFTNVFNKTIRFGFPDIGYETAGCGSM
jgi:hypothetical protein